MEDFESEVNKIIEAGAYRYILSGPRSQAEPYRRIVVSRKKEYYQAEQYTQKQVFHLNLSAQELPGYLTGQLKDRYMQMNAWTDIHEYQIKISKKGRALVNRTRAAAKPASLESHNRQKNYLLKEGTVIPPLVDMGVFTKEGAVVKSMYDKYRQINRFVELVDDALKGQEGGELRVIDFGCGKSYLTFILYYYLTEIRGMQVRMTGLDLKEDVIRRCSETAAKYHYDGLNFEIGDIGGYRCDEPVDMVITLHACDTATDYALYHAIRWNAKMIFSVPCCQHECNGQIESERLAAITRYGIIKERAAALFTDAIRGNPLEYSGYRTQLLEFIDMAHTPKNILIRGIRSDISSRKRREALDEVLNLTEEFHLSPTLLRLMKDGGQV